MKLPLALTALLLCYGLYCQVVSAAKDWGPWEPPATEQVTPPAASVLAGPIRFFQRYISPVDGQRCSMYPTCSAYALQAVEGYGPLLGSFIFVDRLYHEADLLEHQQPILKHGCFRFSDSLAENTFWLPNSLRHR